MDEKGGGTAKGDFGEGWPGSLPLPSRLSLAVPNPFLGPCGRPHIP